MQDAREYIAFISYRHLDLDKHVAKRIHSLIEHYRVPKELRGESAGTTLGRVFRDEEELTASGNLNDNIQQALDHSRYLIVICSPGTPASVWVEQEITYFLKHHDRNHLIAVLVDGTPDTSFPAPVTKDFAEDGVTVQQVTETLAANLTDTEHRYDKRRLSKEIFRIYAAILGCPFDALWQRERRYRQRILIAALSAGLCLALGFGSYVYVKNRQITERNEQITKQNEEIQLQNSELRRREAEALISESSALIDSGNSKMAVKRILKALQTEEGREYCADDAFELLKEALSAGKYSNKLRTATRISQESEIVELKLSETGAYLVTRDYLGVLRRFGTADGAQLWQADSQRGNDIPTATVEIERDRIYILEDKGIVLCCSENVITAFSLEDGTLVWSDFPAGQDAKNYEYKNFADFYCVSLDGEKIAVIESQETYRLVVLRTTDGTVETQIELPQSMQVKSEAQPGYLRTMGAQVGVFSEDGAYVAGGIGSYLRRGDYQGKMFYFIADLREGSIKVIHEREHQEIEFYGGADLLIGLSLDMEGQRVLVLHYDREAQDIGTCELFFNGEAGKSATIHKELIHTKESSTLYSTFVDNDPRLIMASFENTFLFYSRNDVSAFSSYEYSTYRILDTQLLNQDTMVYTLLTDGGQAHFFYTNTGRQQTELLSDKQHFRFLELTDGFAVSEDGTGYTIAPDAVGAAVCDDDLKTIYLLEPEKDPHMEAQKWSTLPGDGDYALYTVGENRLVFCAAASDETIIRLVDGLSGEVEGEYRFAADENGVLQYITNISSNAVFLPEGNLFFAQDPCVIIDGVAVDLENGQTKDIMLYDAEGKILHGKDCILTAGGNMLRAGFVTDVTDAAYSDEWVPAQLVWQNDDGEIHALTREGDQYWGDYLKFDEQQPYEQAGENGLILIRQYSRDEHMVTESFLVCDTASGDVCTIMNECPLDADQILVMGHGLPRFATADADGALRIYDTTAGGVIQTIHLPDEGVKALHIGFCNGDSTIFVYERDHFMLYDIETGSLLYEEHVTGVGGDDGFYFTVTATDDPERNRIYLWTNTGYMLCLDTDSWRKIADYTNAAGFCRGSNEVYLYQSNVTSGEKTYVVTIPAYTLEDLMEWGAQ